MESAAENTADGGGKVGTRVDHRAQIVLIDDEPDRVAMSRAYSLVRAGWTRRFFTHALKHGSYPTEVNTDRAPAYVRVLDEVLPGACNIVEQYANNPVESDYERLKARLRPMVASNGSARHASSVPDMRLMQIKYDAETKAEAVPLVTDHAADYEREWAAVTAISQRLGMTPETVRRWVRQAQVDAGQRSRVSTESAREIRELKRKCQSWSRPSRYSRPRLVSLRGSATRYTADLPVHHLASPGVRGHTDLYRVDQSWCADRPTHLVRAPGTGAVQTRLVGNVDHRDPVRLLRTRRPGPPAAGVEVWRPENVGAPPAPRRAGGPLDGGTADAGAVASLENKIRQAGLVNGSSCSSTACVEVELRGVSLPSGCDHDRGSVVLTYGPSYRDVEELLAERGITVDDVTVYRWVQRFTPLLIEAARPCRHVPGDRWFADETYVNITGQWRYLYRAIDQYGQVVDVLVSLRRDLAATRRLFSRALEHGRHPTEVTTDRAPTYPRVVDELLPAACHLVEQYLNNRFRPITVD